MHTQQDEVRSFLKQYEKATNSHEFKNVAPLIHPKAVYWFTDGTFAGRKQIGKAFVETWDSIQNEIYSISKVKIVAYTPASATVSYIFNWKGKVKGKLKSGSGRGTNVLLKEKGKWSVIHEHLSR
ncbi:MAG TPA: nuclear transport factor 2 family protein [Candidatus Paceibacterota bacterium]|nr:nuclear transport factor 2 family protein [Candidatus Paceibacterota bacterium]